MKFDSVLETMLDFVIVAWIELQVGEWVEFNNAAHVAGITAYDSQSLEIQTKIKTVQEKYAA